MLTLKGFSICPFALHEHTQVILELFAFSSVFDFQAIQFFLMDAICKQPYNHTVAVIIRPILHDSLEQAQLVTDLMLSCQSCLIFKPTYRSINNFQLCRLSSRFDVTTNDLATYRLHCCFIFVSLFPRVNSDFLLVMHCHSECFVGSFSSTMESI